MARPLLIVIAGPTASGKSALALEVAERFGGTIVNADASQVYCDLRVLTARPDAADEARVPHRLFGTVDGAEAWSAARWAAAAKTVLANVERPVLVGGSGLYLRTLLDGIAPVTPIDPVIRMAVRALPVAAAHARLAEVDLTAAARLAPTDTTRVARALEVALATGRTLADWQQSATGGIAQDWDVQGLILTPDRGLLRERIAERSVAMIAGGAVAEVKAMLARGLDPDLPVMRAIGVAPVAELIAGRLTADDAAAAITLASRRYAKRQDTWFRHQAPAGWSRTDDPVTALAYLVAGG